MEYVGKQDKWRAWGPFFFREKSEPRTGQGIREVGKVQTLQSDVSECGLRNSSFEFIFRNAGDIC
jgi:hypothetical protein